MSTAPQPTAEQIEQLIHNALNESAPHEAAVAFDQLCNVVGNAVWGFIPGQDGLPDMTISSHIKEVATDKNSKFRTFAVVLNKALNFINPNKGLGHGIGAESGDLARALRVVSILMVALNIPALTITAGEDPAKIPIVVEAQAIST